jgi:hypothetical protein
VFLHTPKTGGVSTTDAIKHALPEKLQVFPRYVIDDPVGAEIEIVIGHLTFGCHRDINASAKFRYLTQLRHPINRLFSHWAYLQRQGRMDMGLMELLESDRVLVDNLQVRQIAGMVHSEPDVSTDRVTEADLRQAKYNLSQHFDWVGLLERYNVSIARLSVHLGVDLPVYRHNIWTHRREIGEDEWAVMAERNKWDLALYDWVVEKYYRG